MVYQTDLRAHAGVGESAGEFGNQKLDDPAQNDPHDAA